MSPQITFTIGTKANGLQGNDVVVSTPRFLEDELDAGRKSGVGSTFIVAIIVVMLVV